MPITPTNGSTRTLKVTGRENYEPVVIEFYSDGHRVRVHTANGSVEEALARDRITLVNRNICWGAHVIAIEAEELAAAQQLMRAVNESVASHELTRGHVRGWGIAVLVFSLALLLGSCTAIAVNGMETDTCRAFKSWQSERPVEGCESDPPAWASIGAVLGMAMLVAGTGMIIAGDD